MDGGPRGIPSGEGPEEREVSLRCGKSVIPLISHFTTCVYRAGILGPLPYVLCALCLLYRSVKILYCTCTKIKLIYIILKKRIYSGCRFK